MATSSDDKVRHSIITAVALIVLLFQAGCVTLDEKAPPAPAPPPAASPTPPIDGITIASFNIRIFSNNSRSDAELAKIADLLQNYDVIAIQELRDEQVLGRTAEILRQRGIEYGYEVNNPVGRGVKERYAFLYRRDRVQLLHAGRLYQEQHDEFIREPFYATFDSGEFDFTLLTIHVLFGDSEAERRPEIEELASVYQAVQDADPAEQDVILMGDFNFPPDDEGFSNLKAVPTMTFLIAPPAKTTISDTSLYDNFWFQSQHVREYVGRAGVERYDETMFNNDDHVASKAVSDHRPIWAKFRITGPDDD